MSRKLLVATLGRGYLRCGRCSGRALARRRRAGLILEGCYNLYSCKLLGARAARSPATARRTLLGARAARSPPRRLALRARSRCALARHSSSQAYSALVLLDGRSRKLPLPSVRSRLRPCGSEVGPAWHLFVQKCLPQIPHACAARPTGAAWSSLGSNVWNEPQEQPPAPTC